MRSVPQKMSGGDVRKIARGLAEVTGVIALILFAISVQLLTWGERKKTDLCKNLLTKANQLI